LGVGAGDGDAGVVGDVERGGVADGEAAGDVEGGVVGDFDFAGVVDDGVGAGAGGGVVVEGECGGAGAGGGADVEEAGGVEGGVVGEGDFGGVVGGVGDVEIAAGAGDALELRVSLAVPEAEPSRVAYPLMSRRELLPSVTSPGEAVPALMVRVAARTVLLSAVSLAEPV